MSIAELTPALQLAIGPVILVSAVGLLLLTLNNRLSQSIARARILCAERDGAVDEETRTVIAQQLAIIWRRATLLRVSIEWMVGSALLSCVLVIVLFVDALSGTAHPHLVAALFIGSLGCIILGLGVFILETRQVLVALGLLLSDRKSVTDD